LFTRELTDQAFADLRTMVRISNRTHARFAAVVLHACFYVCAVRTMKIS
jgi:hypothetical protein